MQLTSVYFNFDSRLITCLFLFYFFTMEPFIYNYQREWNPFLFPGHCTRIIEFDKDTKMDLILKVTVKWFHLATAYLNYARHGFKMTSRKPWAFLAPIYSLISSSTNKYFSNETLANKSPLPFYIFTEFQFVEENLSRSPSRVLPLERLPHFGGYSNKFSSGKNESHSPAEDKQEKMVMQANACVFLIS